MLTSRLAVTWRLLCDGTLTWLHARHLAHAVADLTEDETARVEDWVLRKPDLRVGQFRARVDHAVQRFVPRTADQTQRAAGEARTVWHPSGDLPDTGTLVVHGPIAATAIAWTVLDDLAHHMPADGRTVGQRRFDAFVDLFCGSRAWDTIQPVVEVTVPAATLAGGSTPGHLAGIGPVTADTARRLATALRARWRRLVTDPAARRTCGWLAQRRTR